MRIEVFADIWCPFTHVGLRIVAERRRLLDRSDVSLIVRSWPLELVNGTPMDPDGAAARAAVLRQQVAPQMFHGLPTGHFPSSTLEALALAVRGYRIDASTGEQVSFALRDALFEQGADISDPAVLASIAGEFGIGLPDDSDRAAVVEDWHEGQRRGVRGSPHFFCGDLDVFCPSLDIMRVPGADLSISLDTERLDAFLAHCMARPH